MSLATERYFNARAVLLMLLAFGVQPMLADTAHAQFFGFSERPRPLRSVYPVRPVHPARHKTERRAVASEPVTAKKAEAKPEVPQMVFAIVSLADQHISVYGADGLIGRSIVSTGMSGHRTPTGIFTILEKQRWHESNIYSGAPMPYMQRVTWSGVAMHEGIVPGYPASHGCIRLPAAFASRLWGMTKPGLRVILTSQELSPFEFAHAKLPVPKMVPAALIAATPEPALRVTLASTDPEAGGRLGGAPRQPEEAAPAEAKPKLLNPLETAVALRNKATAELAGLKKGAETALQAARAAALEANATAAELHAARLALEAAKADHAEAAARAASSAAADASAAAGGFGNSDDAAARRLKAASEALASAQARFAAAKVADEAASPRSYELVGAARAAEKAVEEAQDTIAEARRRLSPVSVVISRKESTIMVKQGQRPVYEAPVTIADPEVPLGTHVFVAIEESGDASGLDWAAITVPTPADTGPERKSAKSARKGQREEPAQAQPSAPPSSAEEALDRIEIPDAARQRIAELIWVGGSIVITDRGLSNETGEYTDLNVSIP